MAQGGTFDNPIQSLMGDGSDLNLFTLDEEAPPDEMSTNVQAVMDEVFAPLSGENWEDENEELPEDFTEEERKVYEEVTKDIDFFLQDYLKDASEKIAVEFADAHYAVSTELLEEFLDAFDEDMAETLVKAEEMLGDDRDGEVSGESDNLDFSIPLDFGVGNMAGTSVAAEKVTGVVSQVWAANPGLSFVQVKEILKQTALDINTPGWDRETGAGAVDIEAAVELAKQTQPEAYTPNPLKSPTTWSGEGQVTSEERAVSVSVPTFTGRVMNAGYVTSTGWLRVRSGPGTNYPQVGLKYPGNAIQFDAYENNGRWVPDPYMPGGGSSRWYRIAGTNHWMSALYIDNTPEKAAEERRRQEEIRRAEEEARRAEEEARRAEEEARRAEEELRRLEEEQRRREEALRILKQQQFQDAVSQLSEKFGDLGNPLSESLSNGVNVYEFAKGKLFTQPDGRYGFYEVGKNVGEFFNPNIEESFGHYVHGKVIPPDGSIEQGKPDDNLKGWAESSLFWVSQGDNLDDFGKYLAYQKLGNPGRNGFILLDKTGSPILTPRLGKYSTYIDEGFGSIRKSNLGNSYSNLSNKIDDILIGGAKSGGRYAKFVKGAGVLGAGLGVIPIAIEYSQADNNKQRREVVVKGTFDTLGTMIGGGTGAVVGSFIPIPGMTVVGGIVGSFVGGYIGSKAGDFVNEQWEPMTQSLKDGWNAITSAFDQTLKAAREKARATKEKAEALAKEAKATYQVAKAKVQEAKVAYQQFKEETKQKVTQIVQQSKQKIKKAAQQALQRAAQKAPRVVQKVANYARRAAKTVGQVINGVKQFTNKIIDVGKKAVRQVIDTGKRAYEATKKFVSNTYNKGKEVARQAYKTVKNTVSSGFNRVKSWFGW
ncbi:MAG: S8 family serine peptidase [Okeania sp. SIO2D1]|nr:S8 family serine peptidase [Okeania sp. SIO2D1]